jgi:hypothetical protein
MAISYESGGNVIIMAAEADAITGLHKIRNINWIKPTTAGHDLSITDTAGKVICKMTTAVNNQDQTREIRQWHDGIIVAVLDSGTVEVVLE